MKPAKYPTISQGKDGYWHAWVPIVKPDGTAGRRHIARATEDETREAVDEVLEQVAAKVPVSPGQKPSFHSWMEHYLEKVAPRRCDPGTVRDYRSLLQNWVYPVAGVAKLDRFSTSHMDAIYERMDEAGKPATTQIKVRSVIRRALRIAEARGLITRNVAALVDPPSVRKKEMDSLTLDESIGIIDAAAERRNGVRWELNLALGERQGEVLGLRWPYLDLDAAEMRIWWQLRRRAFEHGCGGTCGRRRGGNCPQRKLPLRDGEIALLDLSKPEFNPDSSPRDRRTGLILKEPKGTSKRTVPIPQPLCERLRAHRLRQEIDRVLAGPLWQDHDLVFCKPDGSPIDPKEDYQEWLELLTLGGVSPARQAAFNRKGVHLGRHTAASLLFLMGTPAEVVQEILGHSDTRTTRAYVHVASEMARTATQRIGSALFRSGAARDHAQAS